MTEDVRNRRIAAAAIWSGIAAVLAAALAPAFARIAADAAGGRIRPHLPDPAVWLSQSAAIQAHVYAALGAFLVGLIVLLLPKGSRRHKQLGWAWVGLMAATALTSLFITELNGDYYSFVHLISGWTLAALPMGIYAIRRRRIAWHRTAMASLYVGGMLIAGGLTLLPGRIMWRLFLG